jgi:type I restriction-modification system DNA methylase subunit/restriction endonuclease S subunit
MAKQYSCELCGKVFSQKIEFTRHQKRKSPCISIDKIQENAQAKETKMDNKNILVNIFKSCLNILRDCEGLTGEKALRNMSYFVILKLIEPHIGSEIDFDNYEYDFSNIVDEMVEETKIKLLSIVRFSNLSRESEDNIANNIVYLWDNILSTHPATKKIFLKGKGFEFQYKTTYKKIMHKLNSHELSNTDYDVLGLAYEEVIQDVMKGKVLGQFFTQPLVKKMMVELINPQIHSDGTIDTCGDPTMGTGGFLITYLQYILRQSREKNITPNWEFIKTDGLYGKELDPDTYQMAVSNMLISSGHMFDNLDRGDSIRVPITRKFDNILANPPFGIKGLKYDDFNNSLKDAYTPIKSDNAVSLFIQAIIYMLKINGKCAVVLPHGQDLLSKTNNTLVSIREYLMKTCDLKEIIFLPSGIFTHTSIKTCVFYFVKKREGCEVLETIIKFSKTQKESSRSYKFSKTHQTRSVKFYEYNPYEDIKDLLVEVDIEKIRDNSYSLNYTEYIVDDTKEDDDEEGVVVKTLGEVCNFKNGKGIKKDTLVEGEYPVIGGGQKPMGFHNEYNADENTILCSSSGAYSGFISKYDKKVWISDCFTIIPKNSSLNNTYLYYLLKNIQDKIYKLQTGTAQPHVYSRDLQDIKIPIPSIRQQERVVKYLDFIYEKSIKTSNEKIADLKMANEFYLNNQIEVRGVVVKTLGDVCKVDIGGTPSRSKDEYYNNGNNLWVSIREMKGGYIYDTKEKITDLGVQKSNVKLFKAGTVLFSFKLSIGKTAIAGKPLYTNEAIAGISSKNPNKLNDKYLYHYLTNTDFSSLGVGVFSKGSLNKTTLAEITIPVPSLKRQREIVEYCENNDRLIQELKTEIETNKREARRFIKSIVKLDTGDEDDINDGITCDEENEDEENEDEEEQGEEDDTGEEYHDEDEEDENEDINSMITKFKFTSDKINSDLTEIVNGFTQNLMKLVMDNYRDNQTIGEKISQQTTELQNEVEYDDEE